MTETSLFILSGTCDGQATSASSEQNADTDNPKKMLGKRSVKLTTESSGADTGAKLILGPVRWHQN